MKKENSIFDKPNALEESIIEETMKQITELEGVVTNCEKLNIRSTPSKEDDNVIMVVPKNTVFKVERIEGNEEWLKVWTATGAEGYACSEFILVKELN